MKDVTIRITGDNISLSRMLGDTERRFSQFERKSNKIFRGVSSNILKSAAAIGKSYLPAIGALAGGAAVFSAAKGIIQFDSALTRLAINGDLTRKEQAKLRQEIVDTAFATGQSREAILAGISVITDKIGDLKFARDVIKDLGVAATATGSDMEAMAAIAVMLKTKLNLSNDAIKTGINTLFVQGKAGAFTLKEMASMGEKLFGAAGRMDLKGTDDLRKFGALVQIARMGTGSSEEATTAIEGMVADIFSKSKQIKAKGFDIFGDDKKIKKLDQIIKGIIKVTGGSEIKLGEIFGRESIRSITTLAKAYRDTNGFDLFEKLANADAGNVGAIMAAYARYSESAAFQLGVLAEVSKDFADASLAPVIAQVTEKLRELTNDPKKLQEFKDKIKEIGTELSTAGIAIAEIGAALTALLPILKYAAWWAKIFSKPFVWTGKAMNYANRFFDSEDIVTKNDYTSTDHFQSFLNEQSRFAAQKIVLENKQPLNFYITPDGVDIESPNGDQFKGNISVKRGALVPLRY